MNQLCKVCGEPAAGFHFGAFTCEGCKSFFGRTYNNISAIAGCKNNGDCVINKKNRTACKACRLRKCLLVGMSKSGSRYGRRSNWFKIHCLLQEQQSQHNQIGNSQQQTAANFEQLNHLHQQLQARQTYQDKTNPSIKTANLSPIVGSILSSHSYLPTHFMNGSGNISQTKSEPRLSSPSDSGASSADLEENASHRGIPDSPINDKTFKKSYRSSSEPLKLFSPLSTNSKLSPFSGLHGYIGLNNSSPVPLPLPTTNLSASISVQDEPIDLSVKSRTRCRTESPPPANNVDIPKPAPLDLTLVRSQPMSG